MVELELVEYFIVSDLRGGFLEGNDICHRSEYGQGSHTFSRRSCRSRKAKENEVRAWDPQQQMMPIDCRRPYP